MKISSKTLKAVLRFLAYAALEIITAKHKRHGEDNANGTLQPRGDDKERNSDEMADFEQTERRTNRKASESLQPHTGTFKGGRRAAAGN